MEFFKYHRSIEVVLIVAYVAAEPYAGVQRKKHKKYLLMCTQRKPKFFRVTCSARHSLDASGIEAVAVDERSISVLLVFYTISQIEKITLLYLLLVVLTG